MIVLVIAAVIAGFLLAAAAIDRQARRRGHRVRGWAGWQGVRDSRRELRAQELTYFLATNTVWTSVDKRSLDARAQQRREDQP